MKRRRQTVWISIVGVVAVTLYAAFAAVQILVLNPLAAMPGLTLDEIRGRMSGAGEAVGQPMVLGILGAGVVFAIGVAVVAIVRGAHPIVTTMCFLAVLAGGAPAYFVAAFGPGMALADTFMIGGGDASHWSLVLYVISVLSLLVVLIGAVVAARRSDLALARS
ncbi:hypothetical protein [Microbacterium saperdae]|uniref:Uncharacterized protein n=1 Tax=Microbacterium saperdae TaxID=69368 RepID=A0A543BI42_9MICO|nr:hypothetical protein [Microbacterium saperdae]TQL84496.1 hypothetical protein FB560_0083 [Microbacterium saperdae]